MDWNKADTRCHELGPYSRLVDINDAAENLAIKRFIASFDGINCTLLFCWSWGLTISDWMRVSRWHEQNRSDMLLLQLSDAALTAETNSRDVIALVGRWSTSTWLMLSDGGYLRGQKGWRRPPGRSRNICLNKIQEDANALLISYDCGSCGDRRWWWWLWWWRT